MAKDDIVLDRESLDRLITIYEGVRARRGLGTAFSRITPGQRLDALHVCLAVSAAGLVPDTGTTAFWLSHLSPILAETRDSAAALKEAFEIATRTPDDVVVADKPLSFFEWSAQRIREFGWSKVSVVAGVLVVAIIVALRFFPPCISCAVSNPSGTQDWRIGRQPAFVDYPWPTPPEGQSALARVYGETLTAAAATLLEHQGAASPRTLARTFSATFPQAGAPASLLSEMLRRFPLAAEQPIPQTPVGSLAVRHYALAVAERLSPGSNDDMATLLGNDTRAVAPSVVSFLERFQSGQAGTAPTVSAAVPSGSAIYHYLPFLVVLLGAGWAVLGGRQKSEDITARVREEVIQLREARRVSAGRWAEVPVIQTGTSGLPPLPSAGRIARALIGFREPRPGNRLDDARSVRATLKSDGDVVAIMRPKSRAGEFVFLIRRRHRHDHERSRALRLVNALGNAGLVLTAYDYSPDPRYLTATGRVGIGESRSAPTLDLRGLRERHFGAVLVLVTDGDELLNPLTGKPLDFVERELAAWPRRMILTPTPTGAWGDREYRLAAALDAPIGRATLKGLTDLALVFDLDSPEAKARRPLREARSLLAWDDRVASWRTKMTAMLVEDTLPTPPPILVHDEMMLLSDHAPPEMIDAIVFSLRLWLGHGYSWFVATAVHPQLRFDVTLWLGANLTRRTVQAGRYLEMASAGDAIASPPGSSEYMEISVFNEDLLDRLCMLPWFRYGRIPVWLRTAAFEATQERERATTRKTIERLLEWTALSGESAVSLPVWLVDWRGQRLTADDTMIGFRSDIPLVAASSTGKTRIQERRRRIIRVTARFTALIAWALIASSLVPSRSTPEPNAAWFPLAAFVLTSLVMCILLAFPAVRALPGALYRRLARRAVRPTDVETEKASL